MEKTPPVEDGSKKRIVKAIHVHVDKCTGCRACEMACSAFHATPRYSNINPAKARIRVMVDEIRDVYVPVRAGQEAPAECIGRTAYTFHGKNYAECGFCRAACPSRVDFTDPESGLFLKCDMCEADPPLEAPMCVQVCRSDALTYTWREEAGDDLPAQEELVADLGRLARTHGLQKITETLVRMSKKT
jgi:benzoyl-CoA reductase subunit BamC